MFTRSNRHFSVKMAFYVNAWKPVFGIMHTQSAGHFHPEVLEISGPSICPTTIRYDPIHWPTWILDVALIAPSRATWRVEIGLPSKQFDRSTRQGNWKRPYTWSGFNTGLEKWVSLAPLFSLGLLTEDKRSFSVWTNYFWMYKEAPYNLMLTASATGRIRHLSTHECLLETCMSGRKLQ